MALTFAFVEVYIPINPVTEEQSAPTMKAKVLPKPRPIYIPIIRIKEKANRIEYSFLINDIAPL